jgi:hypothetical protein
MRMEAGGRRRNRIVRVGKGVGQDRKRELGPGGREEEI